MQTKQRLSRSWGRYPHLEEAFNVAELLFPRLGLEGELPVKERGWDLEFGRSGGVGVRVAAS